MKKYFILLIVTLFSVGTVFADPEPPTPGGGSSGGGSGGPGDPGGPGTTPGLPIDSKIIILFTAAIALGTYKIILNKKRQSEN